MGGNCNNGYNNGHGHNHGHGHNNGHGNNSHGNNCNCNQCCPPSNNNNNICGNPQCGQTFICDADYNRQVQPLGYSGVNRNCPPPARRC
ncbi:hypothetical protein S7711_10701 [Stachybotrys chartarum IBT 7711]|uniref:Uncharacterized protein n=1 Tax=Stachybotrys chartarum (strain CBS 109288 / IBT 7711) TaxID=1280523 RepID=A0A084AXW7_STACB|nr:hypothetical protein S7711_10701 [Stachybotrys chartarum IBT 7711]KFA46871.1 hypothetical protein S40293_10960 [Stachybotrys chartarum IBT 40293]